MNYYKEKQKAMTAIDNMITTSVREKRQLSISNMLITLEKNFPISRKILKIKLQDYETTGLIKINGDKIIPANYEDPQAAEETTPGTTNTDKD